MSAPVIQSGPVQTSEPGRLRRDLKTLALFIRVFCDGCHRAREHQPVTLKTHDVTAIHGAELELCAECRKLLAHSFVMRSRCPLDPKPACKKCPQHCYAPRYREQIREVMRYSGTRLVLTGRLDYLYHLLW